MRLILLLLIAANAVLFLFARGAEQETVLQPSLNADQVTIVKVSDRLPGARATGAAADAAGLTGNCYEWGPFPTGMDDNAKHAIGGRLHYETESRITEVSSWWVIIGDFPRRREAEQLHARLVQQGLRDSAVSTLPPDNTYVVSLGIYSTESAAQARKTNLTAQHIDNIEVIPRGNASTLLYFESLSLNELTTLRGIASAFTGINLQPVICKKDRE